MIMIMKELKIETTCVHVSDEYIYRCLYYRACWAYLTWEKIEEKAWKISTRLFCAVQFSGANLANFWEKIKY